MTNQTAAIYARKSDNNPQGVELQVASATKFIQSKGWALGPVFTDNNISGAKESRPGLDAMPAALSSKTFTVLVTMNGDRLSRGTISTSLTLQQRIIKAGVDIWFYQTGIKQALKTATDELKAGIDAYGAREYKDQIKMKTRQVLREKFLQGHVAGAKVFGYTNVRHGDGKLAYTTRAPHPEQAAVVQRIFKMYVTDLLGSKVIASTLNQEGVPAPRKGGGRRPGSPTCSPTRSTRARSSSVHSAQRTTRMALPPSYAVSQTTSSSGRTKHSGSSTRRCSRRHRPSEPGVGACSRGGPRQAGETATSLAAIPPVAAVGAATGCRLVASALVRRSR